MGEIFRTDIDLLLFSRSVNSEIYVVIGCVEIFKRFFIRVYINFSQNRNFPC